MSPWQLSKKIPSQSEVGPHRKMRRDWLRPWNWSTQRWALFLILGMIASPFITRWYCLWQVPDVPLTFDVEEFLASENVAEEDDAYVHYRMTNILMGAAGGRLIDRGIDHTKIANASAVALANPDAPWDPLLEEWLVENQPALDEYRRGCEKPSAKGNSLRTADVTLMLPSHGHLRDFARLAELAAIRCEKNGDMQAAWEWHRANLQCGRHAETPHVAICGFVAIAIRAMASQGIVRWSSAPELTTAELQHARQILKTEAAQRTPASSFSQGEYLIARNTLRRKDGLNYVLNRGIFADPNLLFLKRVGLWVIGEPEVTMRLQRQLLLNNRDCADLPTEKRRKSVPCQFATIYELDPSSARSWGQLSAERLADVLDHSVIQMQFQQTVASVHSKHFDRAVQSEDARIAAVDIVLAAQQFRRDRGEFPVSLEQLVPEYLVRIPFDPMSEISVPIRYRRDSVDAAVVWSVGRDGVDDQGDLEATGRQDKDIGYRFRFRRPPAADAKPVELHDEHPEHPQ